MANRKQGKRSRSAVSNAGWQGVQDRARQYLYQDDAGKTGNAPRVRAYQALPCPPKARHREMTPVHAQCLRMHEHIEFVRGNAKQMMRLDELQSFVHQRRGINGDFGTHGPIGMSKRLLRVA